MGRATSYNLEVQVDGDVIHPMSFGEFCEGDEGRLDVSDGDVKYKIRDQIFAIEEIEMEIYIHDDQEEYNIMQALVQSREPKDAFVVFRDGQGVAQLSYLFEATDFAYGKKNAFDRNSKTPDSKKYVLMPKNIVQI
jgi:hypothetical protein